jgi:hypothetical protein
MAERISFTCPSCRVRLRASVRFVARSCQCPRCGDTLTVPLRVPNEEPPLLVQDDGFRLPSKAHW